MVKEGLAPGVRIGAFRRGSGAGQGHVAGVDGICNMNIIPNGAKKKKISREDINAQVLGVIVAQ